VKREENSSRSPPVYDKKPRSVFTAKYAPHTLIPSLTQPTANKYFLNKYYTSIIANHRGFVTDNLWPQRIIKDNSALAGRSKIHE
jgi:hypothetical protein